jgi:hypothetical protein
MVRSLANNQFIIETPKATVFKSYRSVIAVRKNGEVKLSNHWDYSRTTMKYLGRFLGETSKEIRAKVKSGVYKVCISTTGEEV